MRIQNNVPLCKQAEIIPSDGLLLPYERDTINVYTHRNIAPRCRSIILNHHRIPQTIVCRIFVLFSLWTSGEMYLLEMKKKLETPSLFGHIQLEVTRTQEMASWHNVKPSNSPAKAVDVMSGRGDQGTSGSYAWLTWTKKQHRGMLTPGWHGVAWTELGYFNGDTACACRMATENMAHLLRWNIHVHWLTL